MCLDRVVALSGIGRDWRRPWVDGRLAWVLANLVRRSGHPSLRESVDYGIQVVCNALKSTVQLFILQHMLWEHEYQDYYQPVLQ